MEGGPNAITNNNGVSHDDNTEFKCLLFTQGSRPLGEWDTKVENGYIKKLTDPDIKATVVEICCVNADRSYITLPRESSGSLRIKHPVVSIVLKYISKFIYMDFLVIDDTNTQRMFRASNTIMKAHVKPSLCKIPLKLVEGWNNITFNMGDLLRKAHGTNFVELSRITLYANCRLRRLYVSPRVLFEEEVPSEYRLVPVGTTEGANEADNVDSEK